MSSKRKLLPFTVALAAFLAVSGRAAPAHAAGGLSMHLKLDEGSGTAAADSSGNNNNGQISNAVWTAGRLGGALQFNGIDSVVTVPSGASLSPASRMTVSLWAHPDAVTDSALAAKWITFTDQTWLFRSRPDGTVRLNIVPTLTDGSGGEFAYTTAPVLTAGVWQHVAFVYDGTLATNDAKLKIYVDGAPQALTFSPGNIPAALTQGSAPVTAGLSGDNGWPFSGALDDLRIYDRALSDQEILALLDPPGMNHDPTARDDSVTTPSAVPVRIDVLANDSDVDGNALSVVSVGAPAYGTAVRNGDDTITYSPAGGSPASDSFTYAISDGNGGTASASVGVAVELTLVDRLVMVLKLDEGIGTTAADSSGNNNNGQVGNAAWVIGKLVRALQFNGIDSVVTVPSSASLTPLDSMTVALWAHPDALSDAVLTAKWISGSDETWLFRVLSDGTVRVDIAPTLTDISDNYYGLTTVPVAAGAWRHLAFVYDGTQATDAGRLKIYADGASQVLTFSAGGIPAGLTSGAAPVTVGLAGDNGGPFSGALDDVRIYARALSDTEIQELGSNCAGTSAGFTPLNDLGTGTYQGRQGGLYPGGSNARPAAHDADLARTGAPVPLDASGLPDPANGMIGLISIGMSNTTQEFSVFKPLADAYPEKNPKVVIIDCAFPGKTAAIISNAADAYWGFVDSQVSTAGLTNAQVEVAWLKEADANPLSVWPVYAQTLHDEEGAILQILKTRYPNMRSVYLSSRIYAGYAPTLLNPEPYAYESGFSVKWLIEDQLAGNPDYNFDPANGPVTAPWIAWGPYLWADGLTPRSDGLTWECADLQADGTHPSPSGQTKVADLLLDFFRSDSTTVPWFLVCTGSAPEEVRNLKVSKQPGGIELSWTSLDPTAGPATVYDIASGPIDSLQARGGFESGACLAADVPDTPYDDDAAAVPASTLWYRVRARNSCAPGSWGDPALDGGAVPCP